jgi:glycosyltransferase involved in cell wall biosynthesis
MGTEINLGVIFDGELEGGGGFQTQLSTIIKVGELSHCSIKAFVFSKKNKSLLESSNIECVFVKQKILDKFLRIFNNQGWFERISKRFKIKTFFEKKLEENNIDLVYFLSPSLLALDLISHNYIFTIWDLCHRDYPEFPEVNYFREFEKRENLYQRATKKAIAVLTDSELGRENSIRRYGLDENRVFNASFVPSVNVTPSNFVDVKTKYKITGDYVFYPAQFWSHKNHVYIIDAIKILKGKGILLSAIFSGSNKGNLDYVLNYAKKNGVDNLVKYIGFAPNEEIYYLYMQSLALVMPTYFGPTNIPPLEAFSIGTPVFYSNLKGLRDQVGDAAILLNLRDPSNLADELLSIKNDEKIREILINKGYKRLSELQENSIEKIIVSIINDFSIKFKCWKKEANL